MKAKKKTKRKVPAAERKWHTYAANLERTVDCVQYKLADAQRCLAASDAARKFAESSLDLSRDIILELERRIASLSSIETDRVPLLEKELEVMLERLRGVAHAARLVHASHAGAAALPHLLAELDRVLVEAGFVPSNLMPLPPTL